MPNWVKSNTAVTTTIIDTMYVQANSLPAPGLVVGIDEAGKGCVIGDLVIGAVFWLDETPIMDGLKDSKKLTKKRREKLFEKLRAACPCVTVGIHAWEIKPGNILERQIAATRMIISRFRPSRVILDCPHPSPSRFVELLGFPKTTAEHKADDTYPIVSAASIVAKVTRDRRLAQFSQAAESDMGSGYPGDSKCRAWLESLREHPDERSERFVRWGWSTCSDIFGESYVKGKLGSRQGADS